MKVFVRLRRRANNDDCIGNMHKYLLDNLRSSNILLDKNKHYDCDFESADLESSAYDLSPLLDNGYKGYISYASRLSDKITDKAISDDFLILEFDSEEVDYSAFVNSIFRTLVKYFEPYRATIITDLNQDLDDHEDIVEEAIRTRKNVDGRDTVFRINTVNYFDDLLCTRAFDCSADDVIRRLGKSDVTVEKILDGVLIVASAAPLVGEELLNLDFQLRPLIEKQ